MTPVRRSKYDLCLHSENSKPINNIYLCGTAVSEFDLCSGEASPHAKLWIIERGVAISLLGVIPAAYFVPQSFAMDTLLTTALVLHAHW